jgi:hypothetical protein
MERTEILRESVQTRNRVEELLKGLLAAKTQSDAQMRAEGVTDPMKKLTGASGLENAIATTRRMIDTLDRAVEHVKRDLTDQDWAEITGRSR